MDGPSSRVLLRIAGAVIALGIFAAGLYVCGGPRAPSSIKVGCTDAGLMPTEPVLAVCMERAKERCTPGDDLEQARCARAIGVELQNGPRPNDGR